MRGIWGIRSEECFWLTYLGSFSLQHRGQESAGIVASDGKMVREKKGMGLVSEVFTSRDLKIFLAILP